MTDSNYTALLLIIDRSGSMAGIRDDMVGGIESLLKQQAAAPGRLTVDVVAFDDRIEHTHAFADPAELNVVLEPRGMTALHDAMGTALTGFAAALGKLSDDRRPANVQVVVVTDGGENASREWSARQIKSLVELQRLQGWDFVFLGADQDSVMVATELGFQAEKAMDYVRDAGAIDAMMGAVGAQLSQTRAGRRGRGFTAADRRAAGGARA